MIAVLRYDEPEIILDKYAEVRREIFLKYNDPWSRNNVERLYKLDPETAINDPFFQNLEAAKSNEDLRRQFLQAPNVLRLDLKNYMGKKAKDGLTRGDAEYLSMPPNITS